MKLDNEHREQLLQKHAEQHGCRILKFHDGLCDFLDNGMLFLDIPLLEAEERFMPEKAPWQTAAEKAHVNLDLFDVVGCFPCCDRRRPRRRTVFLLRSKKPHTFPWCVYGPDGTRSFHTFDDAAAFLIFTYGGKTVSQRRYHAAVTAYWDYHSAYDKTRKKAPFSLPSVPERKRLQ